MDRAIMGRYSNGGFGKAIMILKLIGIKYKIDQ
jgi:hypothetical protein